MVRELKVLMLGESLDKAGGIVSVQKAILQHRPSEIQISHLATLRDGSAIYKLWVFLRALGSLCWQLLFTKVDLVYIHVSERGSAFRHAVTTTIAWLSGQPTILHAHSPDFHEFYARLSPPARAAIAWAFARADRFIVLSHHWHQYYSEVVGLDPDRIVILPNPVKIPPSIPDRANTHPVNLLFLGRIGERKGAFDAIAAIASLPPQIQQQIQVTMAGDGETERARALVAELDLADRITILDWVNEDRRNQLLEFSQIFMLPSYNEGLPMALLEAMSWGLTVVSTPVGGIPEFVSAGVNGLLVPPGDIAQLALTLQAAIENAELRRSLGAAARETVQPLEVGKYCCQLADLFYATTGKSIDTNAEQRPFVSPKQ